ncbi:MAG: hypothetical protein LBN31_13495 [Hungatella sp.]|jgi:hypothetical protein|nr:hypothetical protein [Hungatella sp.]
MKIIFQEFGSAILAIIVAVLIFGTLFGITIAGRTGILEIAGMHGEKEETDYTAYHDFEAVNIWHERTKPQVVYIASFGRFFSGEDTDFLERYYAKDMEEVIYPMDQVILAKRYPEIMFGKVVEIRRMDGSSILDSYSKENGTISFPGMGVYQVYFQVRDRENLTSIYQIPIAVDAGRD